ncbi:RNA-dependent RNA polymerase [Hubei narna-like virus 22]|uniref:RNA-dependent RNA polymerase n=1 Tax=Hubei narna-like virus 22 TaxID=1922953 RepID=UPI000909F0A2|nr:RNA-dependent RNA polymerase [Hubei narna-like virus 22]APG77196.1 RNA-dependent RNA polymerase [Hubei narna-like virus 22]
MEKDLKMKWQQREWFNPSHLTGSSIPGSGKAMSIRNRNGNISYASIVSAYSFSLSTAPLFIWKFLDDIKYPEMVYEVQGNLEQSIKLSQIIEERLQNERLLDEALSGNNFLDDDSFVDYQKFVTPILGLHHSVGNIGFLQQGSGKLRAVANPNRFVQYCNSPLGEVLSSHQQGLDGCFVYNQEAGIEWVKRKLKQGNTLASFDMSAATDRLDFQKFINEYFVNISDERHPLLSRSIELFKDTSLSPWSLPGFVADMLQMPSNEISWKIGQPLGLRPSFPLLTIMNCAMASQAVRNLDGYGTYNTFACVGDDLVIQAEYADAYVQVVSEFSGLINRDKGMTSSKYAEFCSQLITADSSYALKPRWIDSIEGSLNNIEKFQTSGLHPKVPEWIQRLYNAIAKRSIKGFTKYGYTKTDCYDSLKDRVAIHDFIQSTRKAPRDIEEITLQTLYMRAVSEQDELNQKVKCFDLSTSWAMPKLGQNKQEISTRHKDIVQKYDIELGDLPSDRATSVAVPGIQQWNYKEDCYSPKVSELNTAKKLLKTIESIKVESAGTLISASQETKHCRTEILTDLSNHESVIVHTNKATNTTAIQTKHNQKSKRLEDLLANLKIDDPTDEAQTSMETSY